MSLTPSQAKRAVKSIVYRRRLAEDLPQLEDELKAYVEAHDVRYLAGFEISLNQGHLQFREMEPAEYDQLRLDLGSPAWREID